MFKRQMYRREIADEGLYEDLREWPEYGSDIISRYNRDTFVNEPLFVGASFW